MKITRKQAIHFALLMLFLSLGAGRAAALRLIGPDGYPLPDTDPTGPIRDMGWPTGAVEMANLNTRFNYGCDPFGNGHYIFHYTCQNTDQFNEALRVFGAIKVPRLELVVVGRNLQALNLGDKGVVRIAWSFDFYRPELYYRKNTAPGSIDLAADSDFHRPLPPPRLTLNLGQGSPINWDQVKVPGNVTVIDKRLSSSPCKDSKGGVARVTVRDMGTGKILPGATVVVAPYIHNHAMKPAFTTVTLKADAAGVALVRDLPSGNYHAIVSADGYATRYSLEYSNWTFETMDVLLAKESVLRGTVTSSAGAPMDGVRVAVSAMVGLDGLGYTTRVKNVVTDREGRFELRGLPAGWASLYAQKEGYCDVARKVYEVPGRLPFMSDDDFKEADIVLTRSGSIHGKVKGLDKAGISPVMVKLESLGNSSENGCQETRCQAGGVYEFKVLPAGRYLLRVELMFTSPKQAAAQTKVRVDCKAGESKEIDLEVQGDPVEWRRQNK